MRLLIALLILLAGCQAEITMPVKDIAPAIEVNVTTVTAVHLDSQGNASLNESLLELNESVEPKQSEAPGSSVRFWLGTKHGAFQDILREGSARIYNVNNDTYNVTVLFIGQGEDNLGRALFEVNGKRTKVLARRDMDVFPEREFIYVREIYYRG
ncbi:hypothetical protein ACFL1B_00890 [Nanoarchaeota archaeon]